MADDPGKNAIFGEVEHILGREEAIAAIIDKVREAGQNPEGIFPITGQQFIQHHRLTLEYADELKKIFKKKYPFQ